MQVTDHPAVTMLEQLGGNRFIAMTGAKDFMSSDNPQPRLTMRLPQGKFMEISLTPTDEYRLVFFRIKRKPRGVLPLDAPAPERQILGVGKNVQVAQLRQAFEALTGLRTSL